MCGIAGFTGTGSRETGMAMIQSIHYRGPDNHNVFHQENICLGHARLSIIDLRPEGNQPMHTPDKKLSIVFNGEIYNYLRLRQELETKYQFVTRTDTEVLLYLYREYGTGMVDKLNGMFAFAIYDSEKNQLFIARDRMGKKPLYYAVTGNAFVFASELKAILQHPSVSKKLDLESVNRYLTFDYVPTPGSIIENVCKLEPGHFMVIENNKIQSKAPYWESSFTIDQMISPADASRNLDALLNEATAIRLMSDVPLGVFLSGGLDSSAVAYYAQKNSTSTVKTFSIGFEDKSYDEAGYAKRVSEHLGTEHFEKILTASHTLELIDEIYPKVDEPFADASLIPTYFLSQFTRQHVTVALGGDGSDEIFAGYPTFTSDKFKAVLSRLPSAAPVLMHQLANQLLPASDKNISFDFKVKQFLRGFLSHTNHIHQLWLGSFTPSEKQGLFNSHIFESLSDKSGLSIIDYHFKNAPKVWSDLNRIIYYYYKTYLLDDILVKVDRASMYNSLEVRAPFLDKNVVEFVNSLPEKYKRKGLNGKILLKQVMEGKLPYDIIHRPKKGFGIPLSDWLRKDLREKVSDIILREDPYFDRKYIQKLLAEHHSGKFNHRKLLWNLFMLKKYLVLNKFI